MLRKQKEKAIDKRSAFDQSVAMERNKLHSDEDIRVSQLELVARIGRDFASSRDLDETMAQALHRIVELTGSEAASLFLHETDCNMCQSCYGPVDIRGLKIDHGIGIVGRSIRDRESIIVADVLNDPDFHANVDKQTGFVTRSILCAPMVVQERVLGAVQIINKQDGNLFDKRDLASLESLSTAAALAFDNARMANSLLEQERTRHELALAADIQNSLLPGKQADDYPIHGLTIPARTVAGDFYDFMDLSDGRQLFTVADVSGKGMNAAMLMAKTASLFRCLGKDIHDPGHLLARINDELCETASRGMFVTMAVGLLDRKTGDLLLSSAGHEPALIVDENGETEDVEADDPPLGIMPVFDPSIGLMTRQLNIADRSLYLFTDGVTEGYDEQGNELEREGVLRLLHDNKESGPGQRIQIIADSLNRRDVPLRDDVTMLVVDGPRDAIIPEPEPGEQERQTGEGLSRRIASIVPFEGASAVPPGPVLEVEIPARADRLKVLRAQMRSGLAVCGLPDDDVEGCILGLDEACQNIIRHGYNGEDIAPNGLSAVIRIEISKSDSGVDINLMDRAAAFDPTCDADDRDLDVVRPGGLGLVFMQQTFDTISYEKVGEGFVNCLKLYKKAV